MTWTSYRDEEQPSWCTGVWQPLPAGYDPVLPTFGLATRSPLPIPGYNVPLLGTPTFGKVSFGTPARDPTVGVFIDQGLPADLLAGGTFYRNTHRTYLAHSFAIGFDMIGDPDARIGGDRIQQMHGLLPNDTTQTNEPPVEIILP